MTPWKQERFAIVMGLAAFFWTIYGATHNAVEFHQVWSNVLLTRGPILIAISILVWLHAKYRRAVHVNRA